jgi:hypothetical protein
VTIEIVDYQMIWAPTIGNWSDAVVEMIRVLKPGGYLIFADLAVPTWAARVGQYLTNSRLRFTTAVTLEEMLAQNKLLCRYKRYSPAHYELVGQKM